MDLTARQAELADAALRIVAREGLAAVTFRSIAAESGWSLGAVQKAFATKDAILTAMFARLRASAGRLPASEPGRPTLRAWLVSQQPSWLPLDAERPHRRRRATPATSRPTTQASGGPSRPATPRFGACWRG